MAQASLAQATGVSRGRGFASRSGRNGNVIRWPSRRRLAVERETRIEMTSRLRRLARRWHLALTRVFLFLTITFLALGQPLVGVFDYDSAVAATLVLIAAYLAIVGSYLDAFARRGPSQAILAFKNQSEANSYILQWVNERRLKTAGIIQHSGSSVKILIDELVQKGVEVELLLQNPEKAISTQQNRKIRATLSQLNLEYAEFPANLTVSLYEDIAAPRVTLLGRELMCIGWYTYDRRKRGTVREIWGHDNPSVVIDRQHPQFDSLYKHFSGIMGTYAAYSTNWHPTMGERE